MPKIAILGFLIIAEIPNQREAATPQPPSGPSGGRYTPTLDELFARAFCNNYEPTDDVTKEEYGPVFTR